jgi:hypothetical protein
VLIATGRANLAAIERRLALLLAKPVPGSLHDQAEDVRDRKTAFVTQNREILDELGQRLPQRFTVDQFNALTRPLQDAADNVMARLEDAMSQLAGQDCRLSSS